MPIRTRTLIALVVGLAVAGYVSGAAFVAHGELKRHRAWREKLLAINALVERERGSLIAAEALAPLAEACEGKLAPRGHQAIVGYMDPGELPKSETIAGELTAWAPGKGTVGMDFMQHTVEVPSFGGKFSEALFDPWSWDNGDWHTDPSVGSYLVMTVPLKVAFPKLAEDDKTFSMGQAELRTRVLSLPGGKVLCEGVSAPSMPEKIKMSGRGRDDAAAKANAELSGMSQLHAHFSFSMLYTPLFHVCHAADEPYCTWLSSQLH